MTHICVGNLTIIGSDNGLSPERRQAIIWTNAGILLIGPLGTNFGEILIQIQTFSLKKMRLKMSSAKCSFRLCLSGLKPPAFLHHYHWVWRYHTLCFCLFHEFYIKCQDFLQSCHCLCNAENSSLFSELHCNSDNECISLLYTGADYYNFQGSCSF